MIEKLSTTGTIIDCLVCKCPYCQKEVLERGFDINDLTVPDFCDGEEIECPYCEREFIVTLEN